MMVVRKSLGGGERLLATTIAVVAALTAGFCFAAGSVVQQGVARQTGDEALRFRLLWDLVRTPRWVAGVALEAFSFVIQGVALVFGPLTLVQPIAATDVLFALPMIARRQRRRLARQDILGALAGVAALRVQGKARVIWLAAAAGALYGLVDALTKSTVDLFSTIGWATLVSWEPYALAVTGVVSALFGQSAFGAGALSLSLPVIDTLEPVCAVVIGATVFGERLASSPVQLGFQLAGGAAAVVGIALLSRSKIVQAETEDTPEPVHPG